MTRSRRVWIGALAVVLLVTAGLVIRNQLRVAANRETRGDNAARRMQARTELFAEIQPVHITNCELKRFGEPHDGGYPLCMNLLGAVKAGYSYKISGYDGWGCDVSRSVVSHIDQLDVEFHHEDDAKYVEAMRRLKQSLYVAHVHYNNFSCDPALRPFPSWAFEVLLVNIRIANIDGSPAPATPAGLDAPNNASAPDCQTPAAVTL